MYINRVTSEDENFKLLVQQLDNDLAARNGELQKLYTPYNSTLNISTAVVGFCDEIPTGCGCFKPFNDDSIEIKRMFVLPEKRGSGIASMMLLELEKWGKEKGYRYAVLETGTKQVEAIAFYTRLGYKRTENYGQYIGNENSLCMKKDL